MQIRHHRVGRRQQGAVAIMFGLCLVVLLGFGGLVLDLGHLYVLKSELQNASDSAVLAAAKEVDSSLTGINRAVAKAKAFAAQNNYNFKASVVLEDANINFGSSPEGPWVSVAAAQATPSGKTFVRVATGDQSVPATLMALLGINEVITSASAVAGRFVVDISPLGVCANAPTVPSSILPVGATGENELVEFGFRRGYTYNLRALQSIAGPSDPMLISPVTSPPAACIQAQGAAAFTSPFLCQGNSAVANSALAVYSNPGGATGPTERAINSRMNLYPGGTQCSPITAPPDTNVQPYLFNAATGAGLWSYSRAVRAVASGGGYTAGAPFAVTDWTNLYGIPAGSAAAAAYPAGATSTPYSQTTAPWFLAPTVNPGMPKRRLMNLVMVNCTLLANEPASCTSLPIVGVGRFFLQEAADLNGAPAVRKVNIEFAGMIEPVPNSEIKLYK